MLPPRSRPRWGSWRSSCGSGAERAAGLFEPDAQIDDAVHRADGRPQPKSRQIALIDFFWTKYARRIFAIVSTTSIPARPPCPPWKPLWIRHQGVSRLDADHPLNGVPLRQGD